MKAIDDPGSIWELPAGPRATKARRIGLWWVRRVSMRHRMRQASKARRRRLARLHRWRELLEGELDRWVADEMRVAGLRLMLKYIGHEKLGAKVVVDLYPVDAITMTLDVKL